MLMSNESMSLHQSCCWPGVSPATETALYACEFTKHRVNFLSFSPTRHLLITTRAVYNFEPDAYAKANRIIEIAQLNGVILSTSSLEMLINVSADYDFHLTASTSGSRSLMVKHLTEAYAALQVQDQPLLPVTSEPSPDLAPFSVPADRVALRSSLDARMQLKRWSELVRARMVHGTEHQKSRHCVVAHDSCCVFAILNSQCTPMYHGGVSIHPCHSSFQNCVPAELIAASAHIEWHELCDFLAVGQHKTLLAVLADAGDSPPEVLFSEEVGKINVRDVFQNRNFIVTRNNIYNFKGDAYDAFQWKLPIRQLDGLVVSRQSNEVVLQVAHVRSMFQQRVFRWHAWPGA